MKLGFALRLAAIPRSELIENDGFFANSDRLLIGLFSDNSMVVTKLI